MEETNVRTLQENRIQSLNNPEEMLFLLQEGKGTFVEGTGREPA